MTRGRGKPSDFASFKAVARRDLYIARHFCLREIDAFPPFPVQLHFDGPGLGQASLIRSGLTAPAMPYCDGPGNRANAAPALSPLGRRGWSLYMRRSTARPARLSWNGARGGPIPVELVHRRRDHSRVSSSWPHLHHPSSQAWGKL